MDWFDSESGQTNDFKIGIHIFPTGRSGSALEGQCVYSRKQAGKFTLPLGKSLDGIPPSWWGGQLAGNS